MFLHNFLQSVLKLNPVGGILYIHTPLGLVRCGRYITTVSSPIRMDEFAGTRQQFVGVGAKVVSLSLEKKLKGIPCYCLAMWNFIASEQ